jgi:hypothetical protein
MVHQRFDQQIRCALYWWCCRHCFDDFDRVRAAPAGNVIQTFDHASAAPASGWVYDF